MRRWRQHWVRLIQRSFDLTLSAESCRPSAFGSPRRRKWTARIGFALLFLPSPLGAFEPLVPAAWAEPIDQPVPGHVLKSWTTRDGLPQNMVRTLLQTRDGYLWIGTSNAGLVRFDGVSFTVFDITNTPGLRSNWISALYQDSSGALWIGTASGLVVYRDEGFTFERTSDDPIAPLVVSVVSDKVGRLWTASEKHVARLDGDRWTTVYRAESTIASLLIDDTGTAWIGTQGGLLAWQDGAVRTLSPTDSPPLGAIRTLAQDHAGDVWVGGATGLARVDRKADTLVREAGPMATAPITQLFEDHDRVLWIGSMAALAMRPRDGPIAVHRVAGVAEGGRVSAITEDREGHLWFGVEGGRGGLHRLGRQRVTVLAQEHGLPCDNVGPVAQGPDDTLWIATLCSDGRGVAAIRDGRVREYPGPTLVASLLAEADGSVWVGTFGGQLFRLQNDRFVSYPLGISESSGAILALRRDDHGALWIGTELGLIRHQDGQWTVMSTADGLSNDSARALALGGDGSLWIGTDAGLHRYRDGRFTHYAAEEWLARAPVRTIHVDGMNVVWIGTLGGGLCRLKDNRIHCFGTQGGLLDASIHRLLDDDAGHLWMAGDRGIRRVVRSELNDLADGRRAPLNVLVYDEADGMRSAETNGMAQPAGWKTRDGTLHFPTQGGLVRIDPTRVAGTAESPMPRVEQITINGRRSPLQSAIAAPPGSTDVEIRYAAPSFERPEQLQFQHRLDGYDTDWVDAGSRRVAHYANLSPGTYTFHVAARTSAGVWKQAASTLPLELQPHVYQRWLFQIGIGLLAMVGAIAAVRYRLTSLRERARRLEKTVVERTAEVARQRDEVSRAHDSLAAAKTEVERARDQVLVVLNQLDLGVLVLDSAGMVRYASESAQRLLRQDAAALVGHSWRERLPLMEADRSQVEARIAAPAPSTVRIPVQLTLEGKRYWMEIDVRDEPQPGDGRILYLYNATEVSTLSIRGDRREGPYDLVGRSTAMHVVFKQIRDVARVDATVLIEGETGSGKELVARAIHRGSRRADKPFVAVNAAGLTESLLASQLFGHRRGAFTGAVADQVGVFEAANGGTLFLDEIGDIPPSVQVSLLRVLQEREITRVGESRARRLDVRFLAATHRDLSREATAGGFRQDLLYRIRVATIRVPPLRDRLDDVPLLVDEFLAQAARQSGRAIPEMSHEAMAALMRCSWPGNVRQLKSAIEQVLLSSTGRVLRFDELPADILSDAPAPAMAGGATIAGERERLMDALRRAGGNRSEAARLLGIGRATLYRKLAAHGLVDEL